MVRRAAAASLAVFAFGVASSTALGASAQRWPAVQERAFVANCVRTSGGMGAYCRCELHWLEARYTFRQISALYLNGGVRLRRVVLRSAAACVR